MTGASTGIGRHLAERLAALGHRVYATARRTSDLDLLATISGVMPVRLDVRDPARVQEVVTEIAASESAIHGLVNNAGLGGLGPLAAWTEEELLEIFDVNAFGPIRMTNAFLPLLLAGRGRIVNIGSQGGSIAMRYYGPYCMTKFALEAYTIAADEELSPHGIRVSVVQPGGIVSAIGDNALPGTSVRFGRASGPFEAEARQVLAAFEVPDEPKEDEPESATNRKPSSPSIVFDAVQDALFAEKPRRRYLVGTRWEGNRVVHALLERLCDANEGTSMGYSRQELHALLDEHLDRP